MGMSTHVVAIKPPDEKWLRMKEAWDACEAAGAKIPDEVLEFFDHESPDEKGVVVDLASGMGSKHQCAELWQDDSCRSGIEVDVSKLPPDTKIVRFYNSW